MRQVVLDTETTGINPAEGHRIIEIGCVELIDRKLTGNHYHVYINPQRVVEDEAIAVHGITNDFLADKPVYAQIVDQFIDFIRDSQLVIHNAPFDVGHMDAEFERLRAGYGATEDYCTVLDSLKLAREMRPGQRNSLDALCKAYGVDNSARDLHGALLDAEILADVYLTMTGGQTDLNLYNQQQRGQQAGPGQIQHQPIKNRPALKVLAASADELEQHQQRLELVKSEGGKCLWLEH
ncbi:DNA polymerase III subunit epsilon [Idiomarina seosinensis]|uniref:DNA polymerase III subunit epsilon n=1 Tax=Idiomarina seosinensis TaxID=281739 RepID=A0A432ZIT0_9GAMM|nr:DNA polymerase III subunit epsilon [Idiomarina seosinensis]RUO77917.1 DNA polymerase III subunit epsilon [Idiomarina seosinensis]